MTVHNNVSEPWKVTLVDTGLDTLTGGRVKRIEKYIGDEPFMLTYGDGVSDINILDLLKFHKETGKMVTITAASLQQRFGVLDIDDENVVSSFREKSTDDGSKINAGYMVLEPEIFKYITGDNEMLENEPFDRIVELGQLAAYKFDGYWQCMDTKREHEKLEALWESGNAPWKHW